MKLTEGRAHSDAWEKEAQGSCFFAARERWKWGRGRGIFSRDTHQNFTPAVGGLSVTLAASERDKGSCSSAMEQVILRSDGLEQRSPRTGQWRNPRCRT